jgi:3-hydroxy-9,10-secoandrosta-1,3,5(10)-triene-9,17-dione monooxygenase reductase component
MFGVTIHSSDPFATPEPERSAVRRLRGRLPSSVTLWTAQREGRPAGLTVSSTVVIDGEPGRLLGVLDDESELYEAIQASGRFAVTPMGIADSQVADRFAGLLPAPGGPFAGLDWTESEFGPVRPGYTYAGCTLDAARPMGWGVLVEATVVSVELAEEPRDPLLHHRGRYVRLG